MPARKTAQRLAVEQEWRKAEQRNSQQNFKSPIDGKVRQLRIHTVGAVVTPAQEAMLIVPRDSKIEVEALLTFTVMQFRMRRWGWCTRPRS